MDCTEVMFVILDNVPEVDRGTALIYMFVTTLTIRTGTCIQSNVLFIFILNVVWTPNYKI